MHMSKKSLLVLLYLIFAISAGIAFNPVHFVPADIDFAVDLIYPQQVIEMIGMEEVLADELSDLDFLNPSLEDTRMILFGKFGLSDLLIEEMDFYDLSDLESILEAPELLLSLSTFPMAILTNLINLDPILQFLEGEFMESALENDVYFISETIDKGGYQTKHIKIRYFGNDPNVFLDLFFVPLEENYFLFTSNESLLDKSLSSYAHEGLRFQSLESTDPDSFLNIVNNGVNYSWFLLRLMDIMDGKPLGERFSAGIKNNHIFADLTVDMYYPAEGKADILERTKTDVQHFKMIPDFERIKVYASLPQTGLSLQSYLGLFSEITGEYDYDYRLEEIMALPASFGPEVERYDMYLMGDEMIPYLLIKVQDASFIFNNYVKDNWLETETVGTLSYAYFEGLYIAYDNRYDYIEVYLYSEENEEKLNRGELYFLDELAKEKEIPHHLPEYLWGMFMYEDLLSVIMDYDEAGDFKIHLTLSLEKLMEQMAIQQSYEQLDEIVSFYLDMNYAIQDEFYYSPGERVDVQKLLTESYYVSYYDKAFVQNFKVQTGEREDAFIYYIYYDGPLPEGIMPQDLSGQILSELYDDQVKITLRSEKVVMEISQAK